LVIQMGKANLVRLAAEICGSVHAVITSLQTLVKSSCATATFSYSPVVACSTYMEGLPDSDGGLFLPFFFVFGDDWRMRGVHVIHISRLSRV
jgi:hypothetical protein